MFMHYFERVTSIVKVSTACLSRNILVSDKFKCLLHKNSMIFSKGLLVIESCELMNNAVISLPTPESSVHIGKKLYVGRNSIIASRNEIHIGSNVRIGPNVLIYDHDHNYDENGVKTESSIDAYKLGKIVIEDNVWIAGGVIILRNTFIGKNSIIGARCMVKGRIPADSIIKKNEGYSMCALSKYADNMQHNF